MGKNARLNPVKIDSIETFREVFEEYYPSLFFFARNMLKNEASADDIVQDTFYHLWEKKDELEINSVSALLYTDVRNRCLNYLKHEKVKEKHITFEKYRNESSVNSMLPLYEEELMRQIKKLVELLPPQQKEVIKYKILGNSISDISEKMGISINTVKTHLMKGRAFLKKNLKNSLYILFLIKYSDFF